LKKIKQRTLVVNGKNDIMVPTINSYILQQQLPDARLILYPDSGHGLHPSFLKTSPKRPHASSPQLEPKAAAAANA
jgi:dipeptidyl aminopeptidase/acylaminoacyl peptidase